MWKGLPLYICPPFIRPRLCGCPVPAMGDQPIDSGRRGHVAQDRFRFRTSVKRSFRLRQHGTLHLKYILFCPAAKKNIQNKIPVLAQALICYVGYTAPPEHVADHGIRRSGSKKLTYDSGFGSLTSFITRNPSAKARLPALPVSAAQSRIHLPSPGSSWLLWQRSASILRSSVLEISI